MNTTLLIGLVAPALLLLLSLASPAASCTAQDKASLLQFASELSPDSGNKLLAGSWRNGTSCCAWEGVTCDGNGTVTELSLPSRGLEGYISASLGDLIGLRRLDLSHNSLSGGLPLELISSGSVIVLDVSFNHLNGALQAFPSSIPHHPLQVLNISSNFFAVEFPSMLWEKKRDLVEINASHNSFSGTIPTSFCVSSSSSFAVLDLSYNLFTGGIPYRISECSALRVLNVGNNNIGGILPDELFNATLLEHLSFPKSGLEGELNGVLITKLRKLVILDLRWNSFIGAIPNSLGQLKRLQELHLGYNNMSGELPSALGNCTNLRIINLKSNSFRGELSKINFSGLTHLEILDTMSNNFTGEIPQSVYSCSKLTTLQLSFNKFHGQLSPRLSNLKSLSFLSLANNAFENISNTLHALRNSKKITTSLMGYNFRGEAMPDDVTIIDGFQSLQVLSFGSCLLSGTIPLWISRLARLEILDLSNNELSGPVPIWIHNLNFVYFLDMSNNRLTGDLPMAIMEMPMLKSENIADLSDPIYELPGYEDLQFQYGMVGAFPSVLNLGNNHLTGAIPSEIGQLKSLVTLNLSFNSFSGDIPQELGNLTNLQVIGLSGNNLTGPIPWALKNLHFLSMLDVSNNDLEGEIPIGLETVTIADGNPKMCGLFLAHECASAEAPSTSPLSTEQTTEKIIFAVSFGAFFLVGVLYDQIVLSRVLSKSYSSFHAGL